MRLAAYEDAIYHRDGGVLSAERAFPTFMFGLAADVEHLVVLGRVDPAPGHSHYPVDARAEFVDLPHYASLMDPVAVSKALGGTLARFWRVLGRVDAVWLNGPSPVAVAVALLALARGRRVVLGVRQNTLEYARRRHPGNRPVLAAFRAMDLVWRAIARFTAVTAVGPEIAQSYGRARRVHELAVSFVSERDIAPESVTEARRYDGGATLLSVGRLETEKNPLLLADILAGLVRGGGDWRLRIVGEGDLEPALRARLAELGVADRTEFLGYVPLDRGLFEVYRGADLFLHVSWTEGLPQVLLEAFAARLPVVATEVGGVPAVAAGAALLVPPGDARAAVDAVRRMAGDAALRAELVAAGVARVRERTAEAERRRLADFIAAS
jgi:glycosyltransferase involved in cell wall biosynthesis